MSNVNDELKQAIHLYAKTCADAFPKETELEDISFSPEFEEKMSRLILRRKGRFYRLFNTTAKKAVSAAAVLLILFSASFSVGAVREPIVRIVKAVFSDHIVLGFEGDTKSRITEVYGLTQLPEGFEITCETVNDAAVHFGYENGKGDIIDFSQTISGNDTEIFIDNENTDNYTLDINGRKLYIADSLNDDLLNIFWSENGYSFHIAFYGDFNIETAIPIIEGNKIAEYREKD